MTRIILRSLNGFFLVLGVVVALAIQSSLFTTWPLTYFQPDVVLLVVIWCALQRGFEEGGIITLLVAEIAEIHSAVPQGVFLITYVTIFLAVRGASRFLVIPSLFSYTLVTMASSAVWKISTLLVLYLLGGTHHPWRHTLPFLFLGAATEGALSIWAFQWLEKLDWITFKNSQAEHALEDEIHLQREGF